VLLLALLAFAPQPTRAYAQTDPVSEVLAGLERMLASGDIAAFVADVAPSLPAETRDLLAALAPPGAVSTAVVREQSRSDRSVVADVFIGRGSRGTVASWLLEFGPGRVPGHVDLRAVTEIARFDGLIHLTLDESRQFDVTDLVVAGPDFTLTIASGVAFMAMADGAATALVLRGRAQVRFTPPDEAERGQLRVFAGAPDLVVGADEAFVRLNPADFDRLISGRMVPAPAVTAAEVEQARDIFERRSTLTHQIDLGDLAPGPWSIMPGPSSLLVDFRTSRDTWLTYSRSPEVDEDVTLIDRERRRQISLYRSAASGAAELGPRLSSDAAYDVEHTALDLVFDPARLWLGGRASLRVHVSGPTGALSLRLAQTLAVSSVSSPELGRLMALRPAGQDSILVGLPRAVAPGHAFTVDVHYGGRIRPETLTGELLGNAPPTSQDPPAQPLTDFPFSLEPRYLYSVGTDWYPQSVSGRHIPASIRITVPAGFHVVATGQLLSTITTEPAPELWPTPPKSVRAFQYGTDRPVRYLSMLVSRLESAGRTTARWPATSRTALARDDEEIAIEVYTSPGDRSRHRATPERAASMVSFYAARLGGAPYPSLTVAALEDNLPGGHSPAYFSLLNEAHLASPLSWSRDPVAFDDVPDFFLAHEIAHQWFGQAVAGRDYHGSWISEGFAQYLAWMYVAAIGGTETGHRVMARMRETVVETPLEGPIHLGTRLGHLRGDRRIFRRIVYNKSAVVLHMLRRLIGDDAFLAGLRRVYQDHHFTLIDVDDVRDAFQAQTPLPLDRFFTRWVRESDHPRLRVSWTQTSTTSIDVRVQQSGDVFDVPHDVVVQHADGARTRHTLHITRDDETFTIPVRGPARRVELDDPLTPASVVR
jgi:hypothetical protein